MPYAPDRYEKGDDKLVRIALMDDDVEFHAMFSKYIRHFFHKKNTLHELRLYNSSKSFICGISIARK